MNTKTIAITGKGGVGKTTVAGILISRLIAAGCEPVLAVDADPNTCLDEVLGVKAEKSIGRVREEARDESQKGMASGVSKQQMIEMKIAESLVEADSFDLIAMGRSEGPGCYCYANNILKQAIGTISESYPFVVLDNEAGLENLSRRIVQQVDVLIMVTDPSKRGIDTIKRLYELTIEMGIEFKQLVVIVNRLRNGNVPDYAMQLMESTRTDMVIGLPDNDQLAEYAEAGQAVHGLSKSNPVVERVDQLIKSLGLED